MIGKEAHAGCVGAMTDCFLCGPDEKLVYAADDETLAMSGLGPIVPGYSLVATTEHVRSAADAFAGPCPGFVNAVESTRALLSARYGSCLVTEHGRVPVCHETRDGRGHDPHCYHAHVLMFPAAPRVEDLHEYFARVQTYGSLASALHAAVGEEEYVLWSPEPSSADILTRPDGLMRQFARYLIAGAVGDPSKADWRRYPDYDAAVKSATELRALAVRE